MSDELEFAEALKTLPASLAEGVQTRADLVEKFEKTAAAVQSAVKAHSEAKMRILHFDEDRPEVMRAQHDIRGKIKRARVHKERVAAAKARGDEEIIDSDDVSKVSAHSAEGAASIASPGAEGN